MRGNFIRGDKTFATSIAGTPWGLSRAATMSVVVYRAADRGEIPAATDAAAVIQTVTAQLYYRLFVTGEPLGPAVSDRAAAIATAAARAGALTAAPPGESRATRGEGA